MLNVRDQFPILAHHPQLTYLDSAATTQKPQIVIDAITQYYRTTNAPVHRGLYPLSLQATAEYAAARVLTAEFIDAKPNEIIFTSGATESLNFLAVTLSQTWEAGSNVIVSVAEHHANFLPWQQLARRQQIELRVVELTETGEIDLTHLERLLDHNTVAVSLTHCSNVLGQFTPLHQVKKILHEQGSHAVLIADASQSIAHIPLSVQNLDCDFLVFSGHKLYGPAGIGVLWGRSKLLEKLPPYQTGGDMVQKVSLTETIWSDVPERFEAGTQNIEGAIGLATAATWLTQIGMGIIRDHTRELCEHAQSALKSLSEVKIIGNPDPRSGIISFTVENIHPHDLASLLGEQDICIRAGQHCAGPLHDALGLVASNRISLGLYNTIEEIDRCVDTIKALIQEIKNA